MKIIRISVFRANLPMKEGFYSWSTQSHTAFDTTVVIIETDEDICGAGECCPLGPTYLPIDEGLKEEAYLFQQTLRDPSAMINMQKALDLGAQTREGEMRIGELSLEVARATFKDS